MIKYVALVVLALTFTLHAAQTDFNSLKNPKKGLCDFRAGMADAYVLAMSSQSGFCETYGYEAGKPECRNVPKNAYHAKHLTLHGLWPNQDSCGPRYGFCAARPRDNHCDYPPLELDPQVATALKKVMPSYQYNSCLERHEWNKHGTCSALEMNDYFTTAMRLAKEVDDSAFGRYVTEHQGETVSLSQLRAHIDKAFGAVNAGKIYLGCAQGKLVDVYIQLPALIPDYESIESLINQAPNPHYRDACAPDVVLTDFTKESWF